MTAPLRPEPEQSWIDVTGGGMRLELSATIEGLRHDLVVVLADERDDSLWVQLRAGKHDVQIPLALLRSALDAAATDVHSEAWFDRNLPPESTA